MSNSSIEGMKAKRQAIADLIINTAASIVESAKGLPKKKRIFPERGKYRHRRLKSKMAVLDISLKLRMARFQAAAIASQPIPKYSSGGESGVIPDIASIGESVEEMIKRMNRS